MTTASQHDVATAVQSVHADHYGRLVATLTRLAGDLTFAEDMVQEAFARALVNWEQEGVPDNPVAWVSRTARNAALDVFRRNSLHNERIKELEHESALEQTDMPDLDTHPALRDDMLRLIFTCCHPALAMEARVALTLKTICGLETGEISRAFIVPEATMAQRLVRAKQKIKKAGIAYRSPETDELIERLPSVLATIYLIFNESYLSAREGAIRYDLAEQAIRLARMLCSVLSTKLEAEALLALMLFQHSRRDARFDAGGALVLLADQDRQQWDQNQITEAQAIIERVFRAGAGRTQYALQAAIAALHAKAPTAGDTDWAQIAELYRYLADVDPSPVVALNHAVAIAEAGDPAAGLDLVESLAESQAMKRYHLYHSVRGELLKRLDRSNEARAAYTEALEHATNVAERQFLEGQLARLGGSS